VSTTLAPPSVDVWVVDASVAVKWFLPVEREPQGDLARKAVGRLPMRTTSLAVHEVGDVLTLHSGWSAEKVAAALQLLGEICGDPVDLHAEDYPVAAALAHAHGLTFYDASYAAIARRIGRRLLSADSDLIGPGLAVDLSIAVG